MRKCVRWIGGVALIVAIALQFTNPPHLNPAVVPGRDLMASNAPPPEVAAMLKNACYDCHSYDSLALEQLCGAAVLGALGHVNDARDSLNFSEWPHDSPQRMRKKWRRIAEAVDANEMPLESYSWIHTASRLTDQQRKRLVDFASGKVKRLEEN